MASSAKSGKDVIAVGRVHKWHEINTSSKMSLLKRQKIGEAVEIIKKEISLRQGSDHFGETLYKLMNECGSEGAVTKVFGDLDDKTVLVANIHCISNSPDTITVTYAINTLSTDLPRQGVRCPIQGQEAGGSDSGMIQSLESCGLDQSLIEQLLRRSEQSLRDLMPLSTTKLLQDQSRKGGIPTSPGIFGGWSLGRLFGGRGHVATDPDPDAGTPNPHHITQSQVVNITEIPNPPSAPPRAQGVPSSEGNDPGCALL